MSENRFKLSGLHLINLLKDKKISPDELTPHQRKLVVKYYSEEMSYVPNSFIAEQIGVSDVHITRLKRELLKKGIWEVVSIDVTMLAVELKKKRDELFRNAVRAGDNGTAWRIECDYIEKMQSLGFVYKAPVDLHIRRTDLQNQMKELFVAVGVPTVEEFLNQLGEIQGNGRKDAKLLVEPARAKEGTPDRGD